MPQVDADAFLRIAAELRSDLTDVARVVAETADALPTVRGPSPSTLEVYGAGKLVHDFYTGCETMFERVGAFFGGIPAGPAWHRPPLLQRATREKLVDFLKFRHLFRNLYAFTLRAELVAGPMSAMQETWPAVQADVEAFARWLVGVAQPGLFTTPSAASSPSLRLASFVLAARCGAPRVRLAALLRARPRFASETELSRRSLVNNPGQAGQKPFQ
jgi:hypothetical protein